MFYGQFFEPSLQTYLYTRKELSITENEFFHLFEPTIIHANEMKLYNTDF